MRDDESYPNSENPNFGQYNHNSFSIDSAKKKRGRPRKYSPDPTNNTLLHTPNNSSSGIMIPLHNTNTNTNSSDVGSGKRGRGRPPGSGKKQLDALGGTAGIGFTPHVILINAGEDICSKILAFAQEGPRTICILSANGAISNANICHSPLSGGTVTYEVAGMIPVEVLLYLSNGTVQNKIIYSIHSQFNSRIKGRYVMISLRGSFTPESSAGHSRSSSLSVTLAGPDGQVLGGSLSGMLMAASPVQIIVGSFIEEVKKPKSVPSSSPLPNMLNFDEPIAEASPPSQGPSSGSSDENGGSPYNGGSGPYNANQQPHHSMPMYHPEWAAES